MVLLFDVGVVYFIAGFVIEGMVASMQMPLMRLAEVVQVERSEITANFLESFAPMVQAVYEEFFSLGRGL